MFWYFLFLVPTFVAFLKEVESPYEVRLITLTFDIAAFTRHVAKLIL